MDKQRLDLVDTLPFQNLMIKTDRPDEKGLAVSTTLIPPLELGAFGTTWKEDGITEVEDEGLMEQKLRLQREEKYAIYVGQLSPKDSDTNTHTDEMEYPFYN